MGAVENIKEVADLVKKFNDIDLNRRILTLEEEVLDLSRAKRRAEEKVEELEATLKLKEELEFLAPFYWRKGDLTPYCPSCWEDKKRAVHVVLQFENSKYARVDCPACKSEYTLPAPAWQQP